MKLFAYVTMTMFHVVILGIMLMLFAASVYTGKMYVSWSTLAMCAAGWLAGYWTTTYLFNRYVHKI